MKRTYNFYAGPATLPRVVLEEMQRELVDYRGSGISLVETSHRSKAYDQVHNAAITDLKALLGVPSGYSVLFLGGGATLQFGMVPLNLASGDDASIDIVVSGSWAKKALVDAQKVARVRTLFDGKASGYTTLPDPRTVVAGQGAAYLHLTSNETIGGVQWKEFPVVDVPLVADMSSDILSRPLPMERFDLIYAGAQKNLGPAGVTIVIIRDELLSRVPDTLPAYLSYKTHAEKNSLYNTPPVFSIWALHLVLRWIGDQGGLGEISARNDRKAIALYEAIEHSDGFYQCPVDPEVRSAMNVVFRLPSEQQEERFVAGAAERGLIGLKGHRSVGGVRASIYNAMSEAGVEALVSYMREFRS